MLIVLQTYYFVIGLSSMICTSLAFWTSSTWFVMLNPQWIVHSLRWLDVLTCTPFSLYFYIDLYYHQFFILSTFYKVKYVHKLSE